MTRYYRIAVDFNVEFSQGAGQVVLEPTLEQQQDPRFLAFVAWMREVQLAGIKAEMLARGPGEVTFL